MSETLIIRLSLYGIAALGATLVLGCLRRFPLGFIGTVGVGAYTAAVTQMVAGYPWAFCLAAGAVAGALFGALPGIFDEGLVGDEYAVLSWMMAIAAYETISMLEVTGGQHSLIGIPPLFAGAVGLRNTAYLYAGSFAVILALLMAFRRSQAYDQARLAGLNPRTLAQSGQSPRAVSLKIHLLAGALGGLAGALWGPAYRSLHPSQFRLTESIVILLVCLVGGQGEPLGVLVGLLLIFLVPTLVDFSAAAPSLSGFSAALGMRPPDDSAVASSLYQAFLGGVLVVVLLFGRRGVIPALRRAANRLGGADD
ncbi:MAG: hypothetical protein GY854_19395 [Deltaproteobacteria bacterium]|nr:hypothetical protein [Deltaproteobacteria bacterium]